jgi:hypothetical protein
MLRVGQHSPTMCMILFTIGIDDFKMWYAIWRHEGSMCNVAESKQGDGQ